MRVPQVRERIKEAPAQALRGVFAGIGQLLLITDKLRNKTPADAGVPRTRTSPPSQTVTDTTASEAGGQRPEAAEPARAEAGAGTASAEAVPGEVAPKAPKAAEAPKTRDFDKTGNVRLLDVEEETAVASSPVAAETSDAGAPMPNYGELPIASLRARLRTLDVTQVRQLAEYERAHQARADVIAMFERRIARLEAEAQ
jgi:hypothetical protein